MDITKEEFDVLSRELHLTEQTFETFSLINKQLEKFHNGKGSFYNRLSASLENEQKKKFLIVASSSVFEQLPIYSKELVINDIIVGYENKGEKPPHLMTTDFLKLIDEEIHTGRLLRLYENNTILYVPHYKQDLIESINEFDDEYSNVLTGGDKKFSKTFVMPISAIVTH